MKITNRDIPYFTVLVCVATGFFIVSPALCQESAPLPDGYVKAVPYTSEGLRDPFEGYIQEEKTPLPAEKLMEEENFVPPPLTISGITWGSSFPQAIINGKVVRPGDVIDDVQVISISKEGLVLSYKNQKFSLSAPGMNSVQAGGQNKQ